VRKKLEQRLEQLETEIGTANSALVKLLCERGSVRAALNSELVRETQEKEKQYGVGDNSSGGSGVRRTV